MISKCKELGIRNYSSKNKSELSEMIRNHTANHCSLEMGATPPLNLPTSLPAVVSSTSTTLRFVDLFCGIGGFHQALNRLGGTCVFACDIDEKCRQTYERNYGLKPAGDISAIDLNTVPEFDILCGGFPCQSFSNSGNKKGLDDKRGKLFEYILQLATLRKPSFLFLENVKHIMKIDDGKVFSHILSRIRETGYMVETMELSPHQLGVPQQRERVVFMCVRSDLYRLDISLKFDIPDVPINVDAVFETDTAITGKYRISKEDEAILTAWDEMVQVFQTGENMSPTILCNEFQRTYLPDEFAKLPAWKQDYIVKNRPIYERYKPTWDGWLAKHRELLTRKEIYGKLEWQVGKKVENDSIFHHFIQLRQSGIRVKKNKYFPTLVAIVQTPIYAKERRYITPRECARLQSFPDTFILNENDHTAYKQFGNAVNVDVIHFVVSNTLKAYNVSSV